MKRRDFLKTTAAATSVCAFSRWSMAADVAPFSTPDIEIELSCIKTELQLLEGEKTTSLKYVARVISGPEDAVKNMPEDSFLGPHFFFREGDRVKVTLKNQIDEDTITHWHGFDVSELNDGHPNHAVGAGESYSYDFVVENRAGLYWYHPHPHMRTGYQVYMGLAGLITIRDEQEDSLALPSGEQEKYFVIQDRLFTEDNQLQYARSRHDWMMGMHGNRLYVNGLRPEDIKVDSGTSRIRLLNGSNARMYNLGWSDGRALKVIGTDGGLLEKPVEISNIFFGASERLDILVDFEPNEDGTLPSLQMVPIVEGQGNAADLIRFVHSGDSGNTYQTPERLSDLPLFSLDDAENQEDPKHFTFIPTQDGWTIDGTPYDMSLNAETVDPKFVCKQGTYEVWEFDHTQSGMIHPIHVHGAPFKVIERQSGNFKGAFDHGMKDTVVLLPGDKVKILKPVGRHLGRFMIHCHNLEHEDFAMMKDFFVVE